MKLFTYGTLKRGYGNNHLLENSKFLGEAHSVEPFLLYKQGIPFLLDCAPRWTGYQVLGEVYEVPLKTLKQCDTLEGHPIMYCREQRDFVLFFGTNVHVKAWVYIYQHPERLLQDTGSAWRVKPNADNFLEWNT